MGSFSTNKKRRVFIAGMLAGGAIILIAAFAALWNWTVFLPPRQYFSTIFHLPAPSEASEFRVYRFGLDTPRVEFQLSPSAFDRFRQTAVQYGYSDWKKHSYKDDSSTLLQKITIGVTAGNDGAIEECRVIRGKNSYRLFYDSASHTVVAIKFRT